MTKHVVPTDQVAHLWAHQAQDSARNSSRNVSFSGDTIYSYSTPIGRIVKDKRGQPVALFTVHSYSMTTSGKHKWPMIRATLGVMPGFSVPCFGIGSRGRHSEPTRYGAKPVEWHSVNLKYLCERYRERVARDLRAVRAPWDLENIGKDLRTAVDDGPAAYAAHFPCDAKSRAMLRKLNPTADAAAIRARFARLEAMRASPAYGEKRRKAAEAREALRVKRETEKREKEAREFAEALPEWRAGTRHYLPHRYAGQNEGAALRVRGETVETSRGAQVPVADARRAVLFVAECRRNRRAWQRNGETFPVGQFQLDSVSAEGDVKAGCHLIYWAEVERLADTLALGIGSDGVRIASAQT